MARRAKVKVSDEQQLKTAQAALGKAIVGMLEDYARSKGVSAYVPADDPRSMGFSINWTPQ